MNASPPSLYASAAELAAEFGLPCPRHIWALTKRGDFPQPVAFGPRTKRFNRAQVQAWIEAQTAQAGAAVQKVGA